MSEPRIASNVYYLPVQVAASLRPTAPPPTASWRIVIAHTLWRLRFVMAEIRHVFRTPVTVMTCPDHAFLAESPELTARRPTRPNLPARVIEFSAARVRRRPG
jgi:hypothetical protein